MRTAYKWIAMLALVAVVIQVGFAGFGAFYAAHKVDKTPKVVTSDQFETGFGPHFFGALAVILSVLILLILGVIAGYGKWRLGRHGVLALLIVLQVVLAGIAFGVPAIGFFHAVNALVILAMVGWIVRDEWTRSEASPAAPAPT